MLKASVAVVMVAILALACGPAAPNAPAAPPSAALAEAPTVSGGPENRTETQDAPRPEPAPPHPDATPEPVAGGWSACQIAAVRGSERPAGRRTP